jgi:arylsulfatase A-like enzyme
MKKDIDEYPQFPLDTVTGHAAWTDWPWKLHRISGKEALKFELYNLDDDPMEENNLADNPEQQARLELMKSELKEWSESVVNSINGKDYEM